MLKRILQKPLKEFLVRFLVIFFLIQMLSFVPVVYDLYNSTFTKIQAAVFNSWHPYMHIELSTDLSRETGLTDQDVLLFGYHKNNLLSHRENIRRGGTAQELEPQKILAFNSLESWSQFFFLLWALILATKGRWIKKSICFILGTYILCIFISMKLTYVSELTNGDQINTAWHWVSGLVGTNKSYQEISILVVLLIWIIISLDRYSFSMENSKSKSKKSILKPLAN